MTIEGKVTPDTLRKVLACDISETYTGEGAGVGTIRGLFYELLAKVWTEEQGFNGKRPWGESSWQYAVYQAIAEAGLCPREMHEYNDEWYPTDEGWVDANLILPAMRMLMLGRTIED